QPAEKEVRPVVTDEPPAEAVDQPSEQAGVLAFLGNEQRQRRSPARGAGIEGGLLEQKRAVARFAELEVRERARQRPGDFAADETLRGPLGLAAAATVLVEVSKPALCVHG